MKQFLIVTVLILSGTVFALESANNEKNLIIWHVVSQGMLERDIVDGSLAFWGLIDARQFCNPTHDESGNKIKKWQSPNRKINEEYLKPRENNDERCKSPTIIQ